MSQKPQQKLQTGHPQPASDEGAALALARFLPYRLSVLSNTISRQIAADYDREFGLSIWQWRCMAVIGETAGLTAREVAERTAMDKVAVSRALVGLEGGGHIIRQRDTSDARAQRLSLTAKGQGVYRSIIPIALAHEQRILRELSPGDIARLDRLLNRLASAATRQDMA